MLHRRIIVFQIALLLSMSCRGAEIFYMDHDPVTDRYVGPVGPLVISGEITPGDYDALLAQILGDENRFLEQNKIILASDGGDMAEALKIAKLVKALYSQLSVGKLTGRCVSACFFIYAAAGQREANGDKLLGINRPFIANAGANAGADADAALLASPGAAVAESAALTQLRGFLKENAVPDYLVEEMFRHASDDAYWLSGDDEKSLGTRSQSFKQFLAAKCAWDDNIERETYAGKRPLEDLKQLLMCRDRATQDAARQVLLAARQEKSPREQPARDPRVKPRIRPPAAPAH